MKTIEASEIKEDYIGVRMLICFTQFAVDKGKEAKLQSRRRQTRVGVAFAFRGVLGNIIAGLSIILRSPIALANALSCSGSMVEVINIELFFNNTHTA
jgi:hypothetical protein